MYDNQRELHARRVKMIDAGMSINEIALAEGTTPTGISLWHRRYYGYNFMERKMQQKADKKLQEKRIKEMKEREDLNKLVFDAELKKDETQKITRAVKKGQLVAVTHKPTKIGYKTEKGKVIQVTDRLFVIKKRPQGYCASFLHIDVALGQVKVERKTALDMV